MSHTNIPKRRHMLGETAFLMEYLQAAYPGRRWITNMRVGPLEPHLPREGLSPAQRALMGAYRLFVDALVVMDRQLVVVETKIKNRAEGIGPLLRYVRLTPATPELGEMQGWPVRGELVSPIPDPDVQRELERVGLRFVYFEWKRLDEFMQIYAERFRRAPLSEIETVF